MAQLKETKINGDLILTGVLVPQDKNLKLPEDTKILIGGEEFKGGSKILTEDTSKNSIAMPNCSATGNHSVALGNHTTASGNNQLVQGQYNVPNSNMAHIVGWGSESTPKNIYTLDTYGNATFMGNITAQGLTTEQLFATAMIEALDGITAEGAITSKSGFSTEGDIIALGSVFNEHGELAQVSYNQKQTSGTHIGTITINGTSTNIYAPISGGGGGVVYEKATESSDGLMSKEHWSKVEGMEGAIEQQVNQAIEGIVGSAPENFDTLAEIGNFIEANKDNIENMKSFAKVKVGTTTVEANGPTGTLELVAGTNITLTPDATTDKITIQSTNTNTTYDLNASASQSNGNVKINLTAGGSGSGTDSVTIKGTGATTVTTDANGVITINSTNTTYGAAGSSLGLVKTGGDVEINDGTITIKDDSHNHTISNIDNLQTTLDAKVDKTSTQTITGVKTFTQQTLFNNSIKIGNAVINYDSTNERLVFSFNN